MKIWIVNHYAVPPTVPGGTRHYTLAHELIRRGHEVTIIASNFNHGTHQNTSNLDQNYRYEVIQEVPFLWIHTPPYTGNTVGRVRNMMTFAMRALSPKATRQLEKPDVIIGSSQHMLAVLSAELLARRYKIPFVFEVRDLMPQTLIDVMGMSPRHPLIWMLEKLEKYLYRRAARIISLLPGAVEHIAGKGIEAGKVIWIPNGIELNSAPAPQRPTKNDVFTVLYAGAHGKANALDSIIDTAAVLQREASQTKVEFRFIGDGPEKIRLCHRVQLEALENVVFEDAIPKEQINNRLQNADAFIVTLKNLSLYRWGVSLNKLFDYLAAARPVVFGAESSNNPVAEAEAGIVVFPEDAKAMAKAILQLVALSPADRWEMGLRGRRYVEEHHDFVKLAGRLEQVLLEATDESLRSHKSPKRPAL